MSHYPQILKTLPPNVHLITVSKGQSVEAMLEVYKEGCRDFGENRVEEWLQKREQLPQDIRWHMIGHIQTKKISKIQDHFHLIHSVDNLSLAQKLSRFKNNILLQVNTSGESTKQGQTPNDWEQDWEQVKNLKNLTIQGLMTMAPLTEDSEKIRSTFEQLRLLRDRLLVRKGENTPLTQLSMGMSSDYLIAVEEGATMVRIGREIFQVTKNVNIG